MGYYCCISIMNNISVWFWWYIETIGFAIHFPRSLKTDRQLSQLKLPKKTINSVVQPYIKRCSPVIHGWWQKANIYLLKCWVCRYQTEHQQGMECSVTDVSYYRCLSQVHPWPGSIDHIPQPRQIIIRLGGNFWHPFSQFNFLIPHIKFPFILVLGV